MKKLLDSPIHVSELKEIHQSHINKPMIHTDEPCEHCHHDMVITCLIEIALQLANINNHYEFMQKEFYSNKAKLQEIKENKI